jgi:hypothetical protein
MAHPPPMDAGVRDVLVFKLRRTSMEKVIVIGLGTGRSGTGSLAHLLSAQRDSICFHEMNPACARFFGTPRPILNSIEEFQRILDQGDRSMVTVDLSRLEGIETYHRLCQMSQVRLIGDVASYYLSYVPMIAERHTNVRFLCMRRDIDQTVRSWMKKTKIERWRSRYIADRLASWITRTPFYESRNHWMEHSGTTWDLDPLWDKCFPKFEANSKVEAVRKYCEYYYREAERLSADFKHVLRFVEIAELERPDYQSEVLSFIGIPASEQVLTHSHVLNRSD